MTSVALPNWPANAPVDIDLNDLLNFDDVISDAFKTSDMQSPLSIRSPSPSMMTSHIDATHVPVSPTTSCVETLELDAIIEAESDFLDPTPWSQMTPLSSEGDISLPHVVSGDFAAFSSVPSPLKRTITPTSEHDEPQRKKQRTKATKKTTKRTKSSSATKSEPVSSLTSEEQTRQRNREHARKSRQRKKSLTMNLQQSLEELKEENAKLREFVERMIGEKTAKSMVETRLLSPTDRFIQALKQPSNRVLDDSTLSFMQGLRKDLV